MNWWVLRRRVHTAWLIAVLSLAVCIGVILARHAPLGMFSSVVWAIAGLILVGLGLWRRRLYAVVFLVLAGGMIGLWRGSVSAEALAPFGKIIGHEVELSGVLYEDPDKGKSGELVLRLHSFAINSNKIEGAIWVSANGKEREVKRGDIVTVEGKISEGFGNFAASMYRANIAKVQRPMPGDVAGRIRDDFADKIRLAIPEPEASLGIGYLVGQRRALPPELDEALQIAGLMHVVVASGYNLTILVRLARRLFEKASKYLSALSATAMITAFIMVTGMSPSMSRAGLVAGLSLLAWYYGRKFHPMVLLPFAAAVTLLISPSYGWGDLGWQLSFAAFAGVMILAPLAQRYFFGEKQPGTVRQIIGETVAAQICTLPILLLAFGQFSNVAILANVLILPLVPLAMLLTFLAGIGVLLFPGVAELIGVPARLLLEYMVGTAQYVAGLPWAQAELSITWQAALCMYAAIAALCWYMWRKTGMSLRDSNLVE